MKTRNELTLAKWPFFVADGIFVAAAGLALWLPAGPPGTGAVLAAAFLLAVGALLSLVPYLVECVWNWQQAAEERDERGEALNQSLAKTASEIDQIVRRWEAREEPSAEDGGQADLVGQMGEVVRQVQELGARLEQKQESFFTELKTLVLEEQEKRSADRELERMPAPVEAPSTAPEPEPAPEPVSDLPDEEPGESLPEPPPETEAEVVGAVAVDANGEEISAEKAAPPKPRKPRKPQLRSADNEKSLFATTTLVATAFIGASNKLYLRGEGPGLSWEEGVPMQFVEIGKWSWTTTEATGPIQLRVLKNDEEEDRTGVLTIEPGQTLDIRPDFDG